MAIDPASATAAGGVIGLIVKEIIKAVSEKKNGNNQNMKKKEVDEKTKDEIDYLEKQFFKMSVQMGRLDQKLESFMDYTREQFGRIFRALNGKN